MLDLNEWPHSRRYRAIGQSGKEREANDANRPATRRTRIATFELAVGIRYETVGGPFALRHLAYHVARVPCARPYRTVARWSLTSVTEPSSKLYIHEVVAGPRRSGLPSPTGIRANRMCLPSFDHIGALVAEVLFAHRELSLVGAVGRPSARCAVIRRPGPELRPSEVRRGPGRMRSASRPATMPERSQPRPDLSGTYTLDASGETTAMRLLLQVPAP